MFTKLFTYAEDPKSGRTGWRPAALGNFAPGNPLLVAHDLVEHAPNDTGTLEDEFRAVGALAFTRITSGYFREQNPDAEADSFLARLIMATLPDPATGSFTALAVPSASAPLDGATYDAAADQLLQDGIWEAMETYWVDLAHEPGTDAFLTTYCSAEAKEHMLGWMRKGYRDAFARYWGDARLAAFLLKEVKTEVSQVNARHNLKFGDQLLLSVFPENWKAHATYLPQVPARM